jgi:hypothetical protein
MLRSIGMRPPRFAAAALVVLLPLAPSASAWNFVTHRVIAAMAYDQLTPPARARVDALIRVHPDYASHFVKDAPADERGRARAAFIEAAVWGDEIRNDPRFYDDARPDAAPTPTLPGFPDMKRHSVWHFVDLPFSQDGTALEPVVAPNLVTELSRLTAELSRTRGLLDPALRAYDLVWLIHLMGDIHAPLHCVSRFSASWPKGDQGGNFVYVTADDPAAAVTLHKYWDDGVGTDTDPAWVQQTAAEIRESHPRVDPGHGSPKDWAQDSLSIAKKDIYTFGNDSGSQSQPRALPLGYRAQARNVAVSQVATAASRLAAFLNLRLQ